MVDDGVREGTAEMGGHPQPGDLVNIVLRKWNMTPEQVLSGALVIGYWDGNSYEAASCQVLHGGNVFFVEARDVDVVMPGKGLEGRELVEWNLLH